MALLQGQRQQMDVACHPGCQSQDFWLRFKKRGVTFYSCETTFRVFSNVSFVRLDHTNAEFHLTSLLLISHETIIVLVFDVS